MKAAIFGAGYVGHRAAIRWRDAGHVVTVVTRSPARAAGFRDQGLNPLVCDVTQPDTLRRLPAADVLLYAVGYDRAGGASIHEVYAQGLANVLAALSVAPRRVIYIGTTGVYGTAGGEWVDESTPPDPQRDGGRASLAAERVLFDSQLGDRGVVLRLAGIYGPGRVPFVDRLRAGLPIEAVEHGWLNLIHVDDAVQIIELATVADMVGSRIYNVADSEPVVRGDYYREVARRLGAAPPTFVPPPAESPRAARAAADRRVCTARMQRELRPQMQFPSYREGLAAILS